MKMTSKEGEVHLQEASKNCSYKQEDEKRQGQPSCAVLLAVRCSVEKKALQEGPHFFFFTPNA